MEDIIDYLGRMDDFRLKASDDAFDDWILAKLRLTRVKKWRSYQKFSERTSGRAFAKKEMNDRARDSLRELRSHLYKQYVSTGRHNIEYQKRVAAIDEYLQKIPTAKRNHDMLYNILVSALIGLVPLIVDRKLDWLYPWILFFGILSVPILGAYGTIKAYDRILAWLWCRHLTKALGIHEAKSRILRGLGKDDTMR